MSSENLHFVKIKNVLSKGLWSSVFQEIETVQISPLTTYIDILESNEKIRIGNLVQMDESVMLQYF